MLGFPKEIGQDKDLNSKSELIYIKSSYGIGSCGLYYKHVTIVNDDSSVVSKWSFKLIDDRRVVIYNHKRFIVQATGAL